MSNSTILPSISAVTANIVNATFANTNSTTAIWNISNPPYTVGCVESSAWPQTTSVIKPNGSIELKGSEADIVVNGKSIFKTICAIEERLALLEPNPNLEKDWAELKDLGNKYRQLEASIKEKLSVWETLKRDD